MTNKEKKFGFYIPSYSFVISDLIVIILSLFVVLAWFPLTTEIPFQKYSLPSVLYLISWLVCSYTLGRYHKLRTQRYLSAVIKLFYTSLFVFLLYGTLLHFFFRPYSGYVLLVTTAGVFVIDYIVLTFYFAYRYADEYNEIFDQKPDDRVDANVKFAERIDEDSLREIEVGISQYSGKRVLTLLRRTVDLGSGNTLVYTANEPRNIELLPRYRYSTVIQLEPLNHMRGIHRLLSLLNERLPDQGTFVCCFETKSSHKKRILQKYPPVINRIFYIVGFLFKRIMPKLTITHELYYLLFGTRNRILSKPEVLGRLYCFGFKVVSERKAGNLNWIFAERVKQPEPYRKRVYGPFIRLRRLGKNREYFYVYKMRTMHPYSEFLQAYIYERNSLQDGGKFHKDIRVTTAGKFMRKYWLDELPMIFNLLNGDMKLIGVRPLSAHYFSLYSAELQDLRVKFKPGLLPPFYADLPKTLDEIQASEMKYLQLCQKQGSFFTDFRYFFLIVKNILFNKARSA